MRQSNLNDRHDLRDESFSMGWKADLGLNMIMEVFQIILLSCFRPFKGGLEGKVGDFHLFQ